MSTDSAPARTRAPWQWSRTEETQRNLLDAALELFIERGYAGTSIADIVERASSSVGSLYHHFGDKSGVSLALWEHWADTQEDYVKAAIEHARVSGTTREIDLYIAGARAFLEAAWRGREVGPCFFNLDGPPGFERTRRARRARWLDHNALLLLIDDDPTGRLTVAVFTLIIGEAQLEVMACATWDDAEKVSDAAIEMVRRLDLGPTQGSAASAQIA